MIGPDTALVVSRFAFLAAALFLWGASAYLFALVSTDLQRGLWWRLRLSRRIALFSATLSISTLLPLQTANIGDGWPDAFKIDMLYAVATETSAGTAWMIEALGLLLLLVPNAIFSGHRPGWTAACAALMLAGLPLSGHAAMQDGWQGLLHQANDLVHLLTVGAWIGSLFPVCLILIDGRKGDLSADAKAALMRFSFAGHIAVALAILSGFANVFLILGALPTDWSIAYQSMLSVKLGLVAAMTALAFANRYVFVPRMASSDRAARAIVFATIGEMLLATTVVALVAWFGTLPPRWTATPVSLPK